LQSNKSRKEKDKSKVREENERVIQTGIQEKMIKRKKMLMQQTFRNKGLFAAFHTISLSVIRMTCFFFNPVA